MPAFNPVNIVTSTTSNWFYSFEPSQITLNAGAVATCTDQSGNGFTLSDTLAGAGLGGTWNQIGMGGYPSVSFNGSTQYLSNAGTAAQTTIGGVDKSGFIMFAFRRNSATAALSAPFMGCGLSTSANPFLRCSEGTTATSLTFAKRDAATSAGGGAGALNVQAVQNLTGKTHIFKARFTGTTCTLFLDNVQLFAGAQDVGDMSSAGNLDRLAFGALVRTTVGFSPPYELGAAYSCAAVPTAAEELLLDLWFSRFLGPNSSVQLSANSQLTPATRLFA